MSAQGKRSRWRRLAWAAVIAVALGAAAWQLAVRAIDVDQYRERIQTALSEYTGLPVAIGALAVGFHPAPSISAHGIEIGADDFRASAERLDVYPSLPRLLRGELEIARIDLVRPDVVLPPTPALIEERVQGVIEHARAASRERKPDPGGLQVRIEKVLANGARLQFGSGTEHPIIASVAATGIGGDVLEVAVEAAVPTTRAVATASLRLPATEGEDLRAQLRVEGIRPDQFFALPEVAHAQWSARAELVGQLAGDLALAVEGEFEPQAQDAIGGTFLGQARIAPGGVTTALLAIKGDGFEVKGSAQLFEKRDRSRVRIETLRAQGAALQALLAPLVPEPAEVRVEERGSVVVRNLELALSSPPRILAGSLQASRITALWRDEALASDLHLKARAAEGAIQIAELRGGPLDVRGAITPDEQWRHYAIDLTGTVGIDEVLLHALGAPEELLGAAGTLAIDELRADLPPREGERARYSVRGRLGEAWLRYESEAIAETLSDIEVQIAGGPDGLSLEGSAKGEGLGPIALDAELEPANGAARGEIALAEARAGWLRDEAQRARVAPLLRLYAQGELDFEIARAQGGEGARTLRAARTEAPRASVAVTLREKPEDDRVRDLALEAELPADLLRDYAPEEALVTGAAVLHVKRESGAAAFFADTDLTGLGVGVGEHLEKAIGEPMRVRIEGEVAPRWTPRVLVLEAPGDKVPLVINEHGVVATDVDIDLAQWNFLLAEGHSAAGRVRASFDSAAEALDLRLSGVSIALSSDIGVDAADGAIVTTNGTWALQDLRVRRAESDAVVNLGIAHDVLTGNVTGAGLDADFVREIWGQVDAFLPERHEPDPTPISGDLSIALDRVYYAQAEMQSFRAAVRVERDDIHVRDLAFAVGDGRVTGRVDLDNRTPQPPWLDFELDYADLSRLFVDQLLEDVIDLRGGRFTGRFAFRAPWHRNWREMMPDASGSLVGTGEEGSFGQIGLVTKLITLLRTLEPLQMRLPPFSDEGLVFDDVRYDISMESGVMQIHSFELDSIAYAVSSTGGVVNFRENTTQIPIELNAIRGLTMLLEPVPVVGDALTIVNVRLVATGSPWDMDLSVASIQDQLIGAGMAGPKAVIKGVRDALELLRRAAPPATEPEKSPPEQPPPAQPPPS